MKFQVSEASPQTTKRCVVTKSGSKNGGPEATATVFRDKRRATLGRSDVFLKFQVSPAPGCEPDHSRKKLFWVDRDLASLRGEELSDFLLGTWAHIAETSSRSRLCRIAEG